MLAIRSVKDTEELLSISALVPLRNHGPDRAGHEQGVCFQRYRCVEHYLGYKRVARLGR